MFYKLDKYGNIACSCSKKMENDWLETSENIIQHKGLLYLESELPDDYSSEEAKIQNNSEILNQIVMIERKLPRAQTDYITNSANNIKDESTGETWLEYYQTQIEQLRGQLQ